ncbi:MAG: hypothetical protein GY770_06380 [Aestuariibacter sp.]|nr:hypothetical protein [Aestuariibacter sp.]
MKNLTVFGLSLFLFVPNAYALDFGVGVRAGTTGAGVDLSIALTPTVNARLTLGKIDHEVSEVIELDGSSSGSIDTDLTLDFGSTAILFDWYAFDGIFHATAGLMKNDSKATMHGMILGDTIVFNGQTYDVSSDFVDSSMGGEVGLADSYEPYLGIGWGRKAGNDAGFSVSFELGVALISPSVSLTAPVARDPGIQDELDTNVKAAEQSANEDLSDFEIWPVVTLGVNYAF